MFHRHRQIRRQQSLHNAELGIIDRPVAMKTSFLLCLFLGGSCCLAENVVQLHPFSVAEEGFKHAIPSFGEYANIDKVIKDGRWAGAIRFFLQKSIESIEHPDETRFFVLLYRTGAEAQRSVPTIRIVTWSDKGDAKASRTSREIQGDAAVALFDAIDKTEFLSLCDTGMTIDIGSRSGGPLEIFAEGVRGGTVTRLSRMINYSLPAQAFVDVVTKAAGVAPL
jgi:hypothetical protein